GQGGIKTLQFTSTLTGKTETATFDPGTQTWSGTDITVTWTPDRLQNGVPVPNSSFYTITIPINDIGDTTQQSTTITVTAIDSNGSSTSIPATTKDSANIPNTKVPAGTAGEPINLALTSSAAAGTSIMTTINNLPTGWTIPGATQSADGSWTVITT